MCHITFGAETGNRTTGAYNCTWCESESGYVEKNKLHTVMSDYVYGWIYKIDPRRSSLFYQHLYHNLPVRFSEKIHLPTYCDSCISICRG